MRASIPQDMLSDLLSLWQELGRWSAPDIDGALAHVSEQLAAWVGASTSMWLVAVRDDDKAEELLQGWRIVVQQSFSLGERRDEVVARWTYVDEGYVADPVTHDVMSRAGAHRVLLCSTLPDEVFQGSSSERFMAELGVGDSLLAAHATFADREVFFLLHREIGESSFQEADRALVLAALEGLDALCERYVMSLGLLHGPRPMAPRLRQTLLHLLTGRAEKEIAQAMEVSLATAHQYVVAVYRLFGVKSRPELMAQWLNQASKADPGSCVSWEGQ